jgi:hypothetical protein
MFWATPYPELNAVLQELVASIEGILGETFVAACLQGSFAVGDFDADSDVDFVIAIEQELSSEQVRALQIMHDRNLQPRLCVGTASGGIIFPQGDFAQS